MPQAGISMAGSQPVLTENLFSLYLVNKSLAFWDLIVSFWCRWTKIQKNKKSVKGSRGSFDRFHQKASCQVKCNTAAKKLQQVNSTQGLCKSAGRLPYFILHAIFEPMSALLSTSLILASRLLPSGQVFYP